MKQYLFALFILVSSLKLSAQIDVQSLGELAPDHEKEKLYYPYLAIYHGGPSATQTWKESNTLQYYKELWYFCKSFYIKHDHLSKGAPINPTMIDIIRFEQHRKKDEEFVLVIPGFKDALVLLPENKLLYKFNP